MKFKPGDVIKVKVGGVEYDTVIDDHNVQRFVADPLVRRLQEVGLIDLNRVAILYQQTKFISQRQYAELNMKLGYSVSGFCDLSCFEDMVIENPLWKQDETT